MQPHRLQLCTLCPDYRPITLQLKRRDLVAVLSLTDFDDSEYFWPLVWPENGSAEAEAALRPWISSSLSGQTSSSALTPPASQTSPQVPLTRCLLSGWIRTDPRSQVMENTAQSRGLAVWQQHPQKDRRSKHHVRLAWWEAVGRSIGKLIRRWNQ